MLCGLGRGPGVEGRPGPDDIARQAGTEVDIGRRVAFAFLGRIRERDFAACLIVERDLNRPGPEDLADPLSDQVDDRLEVELLGEGRADLVDDRELGRPLLRLAEETLGLIEQARVLEGHAHARGERAEQADVGIVVNVRFGAFERDHAKDTIARQDRHPEP